MWFCTLLFFLASGWTLRRCTQNTRVSQKHCLLCCLYKTSSCLHISACCGLPYRFQLVVIVWLAEEYFAGSPASLTRSLSPNSVNNTNDLDIGSRLYHLVSNILFILSSGNCSLLQDRIVCTCQMSNVNLYSAFSSKPLMLYNVL